MHAPAAILADVAKLIGLPVRVAMLATKPEFAGEDVTVAHEQQKSERDEHRYQADDASHCTPDKSLAVITPTIMVATIAPKSIMLQ
mgnify:FL=1